MGIGGNDAGVGYEIVVGGCHFDIVCALDSFTGDGSNGVGCDKNGIMNLCVFDIFLKHIERIADVQIHNALFALRRREFVIASTGDCAPSAGFDSKNLLFSGGTYIHDGIFSHSEIAAHGQRVSIPGAGVLFMQGNVPRFLGVDLEIPDQIHFLDRRIPVPLCARPA